MQTTPERKGIEMKQARDLTKAQFDAACQRRGFKRVGFLGYYDIGHDTSVSIHNAGRRRRDQLAYLIREADKAEKWQRDQLSKRFQALNQLTDYPRAAIQEAISLGIE